MKIIIVGAGEVGFNIANRLAVENKDVVVIDKDPVAIRRVSDNIDVQVVTGSGSSPSVLKEAGIKEAEILLAVTDSDEINLVACLVSTIISPTTKKLARIRNSDYDEYYNNFREKAPHIDTVINPEIEVVRTIDRLMSVPGAVDVGELADGRVKLVGIRLDKDARLAGSRLSDLPGKIGGARLLIAAIIRNDEDLIIPRGNDKLKPGDIVYFISEEDKLLQTLKAFDKQAQPLKRVMIIGAGSIGTRLATLLEKKSIHTRIVEKDQLRCAELADQMNKVVVLHGDGSDQSLLIEENIQDMDFVVTLTSDDETNILVSLLTKRMGAHNTITKVSRFSYMPLMSTIGIEQVVSSRLSAVNTILQHIRKGKVLSVFSIMGEQAEVMEAQALETSDIVGKALKDFSFPKGALLIGIIRKERVIIPSGSSVVEPDDRIIIFAKRDAVSSIEKILTVKLEFF